MLLENENFIYVGVPKGFIRSKQEVNLRFDWSVILIFLSVNNATQSILFWVLPKSHKLRNERKYEKKKQIFVKLASN